MPSFDIVSRVDFQEIDNAIANALREITNRYDFKGSNTTLERSEKVITIVTDDDLKLTQVNDILISHFVRRKLDPLALGKKDKEKAGGDRIRQTISLVEGIEQDVAKKITSEIKSSKMKVQAKINGNELRIDGKKRDDLQSAMQLIEDLEKRFTGRIKNITYRTLQNKHSWEEEGEIWDEHPAMIIKGKQLDWMVYSRKHTAHRNGTQDVSTYMIVSKDNYALNEETGYYESICSSLTPQSPTKDDVYFFGPICIDQSNTDVSLGDQYAARALALLNDVSSMNMVSTLSNYKRYMPEHRIDFDALSQLSVY